VWNIKKENIKSVGCEGTNGIVEQTAGVIQQLDETFKHPLPWLHANELPLPHLSNNRLAQTLWIYRKVACQA